MELERIALLINRLSEKSRAGTIHWQEDTSNSFRASLGKYFVSISVHQDDQDDPFTDPDYYFGIYLRDSNSWIDSVSDDELKDVLPGSFKVMQNLYRDARRTARGIGEIVDDLLKAMDDE